jgi:hypothetical protein
VAQTTRSMVFGQTHCLLTALGSGDIDRQNRACSTVAS